MKKKMVLKKPAKKQERKKWKKKIKEIREINKRNFKKEKESKNLCEGTKPLLQSRAHGNSDKPLLPLFVCKG
jgi:hypothetical protein